MTHEATYVIAPKGFATSFTESELPYNYASVYKNRFTNQAGGAEKRQGIEAFGGTVTGSPTLTGFHELVLSDGTQVFFTSGAGVIYKLSGGAWSQVYTGLNATARLRSVQFDEKLIFWNGVDRQIYTDDGDTFQELVALNEQGTTGSGTSTTVLTDADVTAWATDTGVAVNDLVHNITRDAYGIITKVSGATLEHTSIGIGALAIGSAATDQTNGDAYRIIDLVELNIIPADPADDNVATATAGTSAAVIVVSGVDFSTTDIRVGDFVRNTTQSAVTDITAVSANINVTPMTGQASGDSLLFFKSAMPIATFVHTHYGRAYYVDERDQRKIRISGANDPQDLTTDAGTLDSTSFNFGGLQPQGDVIKALASYQRFLVLGGFQNVYLYQGTTPIGDNSDFNPIGLFPQGCISTYGMVSIGNDVVFVSPDGLQAVSLVDDASQLNRDNLSAQLNRTLRQELKGVQEGTAPESDVQLFHYPRRSWLILKIGTQLYVYNYTRLVGEAVGDQAGFVGSWHLFDGKMARQEAYHPCRCGTLRAVGGGGKTYNFDQDTYDDDGEVYDTEYKTGWLSLEEPKKTVRQKHVKYLKPIFEVGQAITYNVTGEAPFSGESTDTITISSSGGATPIGLAVVGSAVIGGSPVQNEKYPLRLNGEVCRLNFTTSDNKGPDILGRFTFYAQIMGRR